ncbi:hypothetical protein [Geopsychrobacter electrodiphilus]|uniref:hypothetical protein n=1 Tax=Geopsychrobacter electrodiphilus TaxID=225196 RepID=UPI00036FB2DF|nr:hypothetical protein [Geopsychrobacter electrodiphilus]
MIKQIRVHSRPNIPGALKLTMLENHSRPPLTKSLFLCIEDHPLSELLKALMREWGYHQTENPEEQSLLVISEGLPQPSGFQQVLTFHTSPSRNRQRLQIPLTIENLYLALESYFHREPRKHLRINIDWPIRVTVRDQQFLTHAVTVADCGIRFISPIDLDRREEMQILIEREDETYNLHAEVVYSIVGKEIGRGDKIEVAVVCTPQSKEVRDSLRSRIIDNYLARVRPVLGSNLFAEALRQLNSTSMSQTVTTARPVL